MTSNWRTSNLPNDQTDLEKLMQWFHEHDVDWLSDALWLRYTKIARQVYSPNDSSLAWELREAHFDQVQSATEGSKKDSKIPPFPYTILPERPPSDDIDRLNALPQDVRVEILSYLLLPDVRTNTYGSQYVAGHVLNNLALTSRMCRDQVEAFCSHSLLVWKHNAESRCEGGETSKWVEWRQLGTYVSNARMEYVLRTRKFCGSFGIPTEKLSERWPGLLCCEGCEYEYNGQFEIPEICKMRAAAKAITWERM